MPQSPKKKSSRTEATTQPPQDDIVLARTLGSRHGLRYPGYVNMLVHEAVLDEEEHQRKKRAAAKTAKKTKPQR